MSFILSSAEILHNIFFFLFFSPLAKFEKSAKSVELNDSTAVDRIKGLKAGCQYLEDFLGSVGSFGGFGLNYLIFGIDSLKKLKSIKFSKRQ